MTNVFRVFVSRSLLVLPVLLALPALAEDAGAPAARAIPAMRAPAPGSAPQSTIVAPPRRPMSAEEKAVLDIQEKARLDVEHLSAGLAGMHDAAAELALQKRIEQIKRDAWVHALQTHAAFARQRGDLETAMQADRTIDRLLHPRPEPPAGALPQGPDRQFITK